MTGVVHAFEAREGGRFSMSLMYPESETAARGKTDARTDTFEGRFVKLVPNEQIVWATVFRIRRSVLRRRDDRSPRRSSLSMRGTEVTMRCDDIPAGVRLEDNETRLPPDARSAREVSGRVSGGHRCSRKAVASVLSASRDLASDSVDSSTISEDGIGGKPEPLADLDGAWWRKPASEHRGGEAR